MNAWVGTRRGTAPRSEVACMSKLFRTAAQPEGLQHLADEDLAEYIVAGRHDALTVLFDRYHRLIYSIALRIVRDTGEAEEVVQTVFLDIFRAAANFDPNRGMLKVWILQYAYHRALHRKRHLVANHFY